jgi:hypothetical protein
MNVFQATFSCKPEDVKLTHSDFITEFGEDLWKQKIFPFVSRRTAYIWFAPASVYQYWWIDRLAENMANRLNETYNPPPEFLAVDLEDLPLAACASCGAEITSKTQEDGNRWGYTEPICYPCYGEKSLEDSRKRQPKP